MTDAGLTMTQSSDTNKLILTRPPIFGQTDRLQLVTMEVKIELPFFVLGIVGAGRKQEHGQERFHDFLWIYARAEFSLAVLPFAVFFGGV